MLVVFIITSCANTGIKQWRPKDKTGVVSTALCGACDKPYDYQMKDMEKAIKKKCKTDKYEILEEGQMALSAGVIADDMYYIKFKCL
jgi:hypothetical protein